MCGLEKYEIEEIEERGRVLNKELGICGIVFYNEIKKYGYVFCKCVLELVCFKSCMRVFYEEIDDEIVFCDIGFYCFIVFM